MAISSKQRDWSQVLIERRIKSGLSVPRTASQNPVVFYRAILDPAFVPVSLPPCSVALQCSLEGSREQIVLVRARIEKRHLETLRTAPGVVAVFDDTFVSPFGSRYGISRSDDWLVDVEPSSSTLCPIPPGDSNPTKARGCLLDVAKYLGADEIWSRGVRGEGIAIGIVDGGITAEGRLDANQPGLVPNVVDGWPRANWGTIADWRGHGNMVAIDALGIAPKAVLYDIRISHLSEQTALISDAIAGIDWAIEKFRATGSPQILCCGWGIYRRACDPRYAVEIGHPLTRKIVEALDEGLLVVFAAGNGGQSCPATWCGDDFGPAKGIWGANGHPRVISVGAANIEEELISYSSQGPSSLDEFKPDVCGISHFAGYFCSDSGTSTASATVAGLLALLKQVRPSLTQEAARKLLKSSAKDIGPPGWDRHSGSGIVQAQAAFNKIAQHQPLFRFDGPPFERLKTENHHLRELYIELALERAMQSKPVS